MTHETCQECGMTLHVTMGDDLDNRYCIDCLENKRTPRIWTVVIVTMVLSALIIAITASYASAADLRFRMFTFCATHPGECVHKNGRTPSLEEVISINDRVNNAVRYVADERDTWQITMRAGDCEDYALTKRSHLMRMGVDTDHMFFRILLAPNGVGHATLVVRVDDKFYELDNSKNFDGRTIRPIEQSPHAVISIYHGDLLGPPI
jgi:predicted transglutaminase-like cysteine proteinase